jgi:hypothetical protein
MTNTLELCRSLREKLDLLNTYLTQTERLEAGIGLQDPSAMIELLGRRQLLIEEMDRIDRKMGAGLAEVLSGPPGSCGEPGKNLRALSQAMREVLGKIKGTDERCMEQLACLHQEVKSEVTERSYGARVIHCYRGKPGDLPRFIDVNR